MKYEFTVEWFDVHIPKWEPLLLKYQPKTILEVGCYEGRSTCFIIKTLGVLQDLTLDCVDNWAGSNSKIKKAFDNNTSLAISEVTHNINHKVYINSSLYQLSDLLINEKKKEYYDFIYIDAYHASPFVLHDAILSLQLVKNNGIIIFDDYEWVDPYHSEPQYSARLALNYFIDVYKDYIKVLDKGWQLTIQKIKSFDTIIY